MPEKYYSQYGQDEYLDKKIFKGLQNGFFLEIGANDGITYSNTIFFEKHRAWNGICIEPHPTAFSKLLVNRKCKTINTGISDQAGELEFLKIEGYSEMLSGLKSNYDKDHLQRIENEIKEHGGSYETIMIPCQRLDTLLQENNVQKIDYCSVDIEGGELEVLESVSSFLEAGLITALSIENNYYGTKLKKYLRKFRYKLIATMKCDELYLRQKNRFFF